MDKYIYDVISTPKDSFNKRLSEYQKNGWEVAGNAVVEGKKKSTNWNISIEVPVRKKINKINDPVTQLTKIIDE